MFAKCGPGIVESLPIVYKFFDTIWQVWWVHKFHLPNLSNSHQFVASLCRSSEWCFLNYYLYPSFRAQKNRKRIEIGVAGPTSTSEQAQFSQRTWTASGSFSERRKAPAPAWSRIRNPGAAVVNEQKFPKFDVIQVCEVFPFVFFIRVMWRKIKNGKRRNNM